MDRETKNEIIGGKNFKFYTYLTGREHREYNTILMSMAPINMKGELEGMVDPKMLNESVDYLLKTVISSIDDNIDKASFVNTILDMRSDDTEKVILSVKENSGTEKKKVI